MSLIMLTSAEKVAALEAKHAKRRAADEAEMALMRAAKVAPDSLLVGSLKMEPWLSYKVETVTDGLAVLEAWGTLETVEARDHGCLGIGPAAHHALDPAASSSRAELRWTVETCVLVDQTGGDGYGPSLKLIAWATDLEGRLVRLCVDVASPPAAWLGRKSPDRDDRRSHHARWSFQRPEVLHATSLHHVLWAGTASTHDASWHIEHAFQGTAPLAALLASTTNAK